MIRALAAIGSLIALFTAYMHMTGAAPVKEIAAASDSQFFSAAIPQVWMLISVHLVFIAFLAFGLSFYKSRACAAILMAFGVWLLVDAAMVFAAAGPFIGVYALAAAGLCYLIAGFMLRRQMT